MTLLFVIASKDVVYESEIKLPQKKKKSSIWDELRPGTAMKREVCTYAPEHQDSYTKKVRNRARVEHSLVYFHHLLTL